MIQKRMRKFGTEEWRMINDDDCSFCTFAAKHTIFSTAGDGIFIEDDDGNVRLVECVVPGTPLLLRCESVTAEYARTRIAHEASN